MNPISAIASVVGSIIGRLWPDKTEEQKQQFLMEMQRELNDTQLAVSQLEVNKAEAANPNLFVSGARPFIMWGLGFALLWHFLFEPMIIFLLSASGHAVPVMPDLNINDLMPVLFGMLGLGTMRTVEKLKGVARAS